MAGSEEAGGEIVSHEWRSAAECARVGDDAWYPESFQIEEGRQQAREVASICFLYCPVRLTCLLFALDVVDGTSEGYRYGVWGGLTPKQRQRVQNVRDGKPSTLKDRNLARFALNPKAAAPEAVEAA